MSLTLLGFFFLLAALGIPLAVSLGLAAAITLYLYDLPLSVVSQAMYTSMNSFLLVAVPLFILAGRVMEQGGVSDRIFAAANGVVGRWRGGLGQVNIVASMVFGGISGSSVADVSGLGPLEIRAMTERKYPRPYAAALTMVTSTMASVVPPSILMIIAAATAGQSVGAALAGGLGPAIVLLLLFALLNYVLSVRRGMGDVVPLSGRQALIQIAIALPALGAPLIILGGIFQGFVTPTEAAGLAVLYTLFIGTAIYREVRWRMLPGLITRAGINAGTILFIAMAASVATYIFTIDGLPLKVSSTILALSDHPVAILLLLGVALVIVGMFMDIIAAILILTPVLLPTALAVGVDPIHFIVFLVTALSVGLSSPPVGVCLFATAHVSGLRVETIVRAAVPYYIVMLLALVLLALFPSLVLWPVQILM